MQERLRQVSQRQMKQFCILQLRQQQARRQELAARQSWQPPSPRATPGPPPGPPPSEALQMWKQAMQAGTSAALQPGNTASHCTASGGGSEPVVRNAEAPFPREPVESVASMPSDAGADNTSATAAVFQDKVRVVSNLSHGPTSHEVASTAPLLTEPRKSDRDAYAPHSPAPDQNPDTSSDRGTHTRMETRPCGQQEALSKIHQAMQRRHNPPRSSFSYVQVVGGGVPAKRIKLSLKTDPASSPAAGPRSSGSTASLQEYLDVLLASRGYAPRKRPVAELRYHQPPTPLQLASFGSAVCSTIKPDGEARLTALLDAGLSPNPTNKFGESPFFLACKRGLHALVRAFLRRGADVRVADDAGRTPLHYVAWGDPPCLRSARLLLEADARLLYATDRLGRTPLDFVRFTQQAWIEFLESSKEEFWPVMDDGGGHKYSPEVRQDDSTGLPDPKESLTVELAEKVANGHILPEEARRQWKKQGER